MIQFNTCMTAKVNKTKIYIVMARDQWPCTFAGVRMRKSCTFQWVNVHKNFACYWISLINS